MAANVGMMSRQISTICALLAVYVSIFINAAISQTCQTSNAGNTLLQRFNASRVSQICFDEPTATCVHDGHEGLNNMIYNCSVMSEGIERCACVENMISAEVVFLIDGTGRDELTFEENSNLWSYFTGYWPEWYIADISSNQLETVTYHWIVFGTQVEYIFTFSSESGMLPNWPTDEWPASLRNATNNVNLCSALEATFDIFESSEKAAKMIIYSAYNTPTIDAACSDTYSFDGIDTFALRWSNSDVDLDDVESTFGEFTQCTYITESGGWAPDTLGQSRPVLRYLQGSASDFVCDMANC